MLMIRSLRLPVVGCCLFVAGCVGGTSNPSRHYTLNPLEPGPGAVAAPVVSVLTVGPVVIPEYLDRPQIVTRSGSNELILNEFNRWGEDLDKEVSQLIVTDLSERLGAGGIAVFAWRAVPLTTVKNVYRVAVDFSRFDGTPGKDIVLKATWRLFRKQGGGEEQVLAKEVVLVEAVSGNSYEDLVAAMAKGLRRFTALMSDAIAAECSVR